ncbi:Tim44/TimA family putative adaptor protein [Novosphingobium lentum]|uniref:Tim44/TimA family putative adaptor protein n=1 Tax=Novosphingobium lentum TaxID=145287 RepID=UPI00082ABF1E|nr:Tim44/TimA family putative adaptor protein [Novosphingobium lentum]
MVAAFLGLRLYSVLGRRPEQNEEPLRRIEQPDALRSARPVAPAAPKVAAENPATNARPLRELPLAERPGFLPAAETGIRAIVAADRRFDVGLFVAGARGAYGMVLEAFWRGDKDELSQLCDSDVYQGFVDAIDVRTAAGETVDNRLIRIEEASVVSADFEAPIARITVRFVADIATVTRNAEGAVIAGSLDDALESRDVWTFSRDLTSRDPNWLLDETDEG